MKNSRLRASLAGWVLLGVLVLGDRTGVGAVTLLAAGLHEVGHYLAVWSLGLPLSGVRVEGLGARMDVSGRVLSYGEEWLVAAAGPLASLLLSVAAAPLWSVWETARIFSCVSLLLGLFNLLPIRSFDGGRMLEVSLSSLFGPRAAERVLRISTAVLLILLWATAVYFLLIAADGLSLLCFSLSLLLRFFDGEHF